MRVVSVPLPWAWGSARPTALLARPLLAPGSPVGANEHYVLFPSLSVFTSP